MIHTFVKGEPNWVDPLNANFQEIATTAGGAIPASEKGAAGGVATLDSAGKLAQMPTAADVGAEVQSGSNSNGSWAKWPDGTMIAYGVVTSMTIPANGTGAISTDSLLFPVAFSAPPIMTLTLLADTSTGLYAKLGNVSSNLWWGSATNTGGTERTVKIHWQAIGRWR